MTPIQRYQSDVQNRKIQTDDEQWLAVQSTQRLYSELSISSRKQSNFFSSLFSKNKSIRGLYLWGGTGRGKTYLVDSFYECLHGDKKHRVHFHRFMLDIHMQLENLPKSQNPLDIIARQLAEKMDVLCLDEFHVHDIADAMLMAGLLKSMFEQGITLVATSNISINNLYKNGLQRERFMHAIELLKKHTEEFDLGNGTDYRFNILDQSEHYYLIGDKNTIERGEDYLHYKFVELAPCRPKTSRTININNREIKYNLCADDVVWFDFHELFQTNRSAHDYIEIAGLFQTVLLSNVPVFEESDDAAAKRFIHFIDAIYDHNVKLLLSATAKPNELYRGERLKFAFDRTISRLTEMGTEHYLRLAHNSTRTVRMIS